MRKYILFLICIPIFGSPVCAQLPQRVSDLNPVAGNAKPRYLTSFNNRLYFSADNGNSRRELWSYDGSASLPAAPGYRVEDFGIPFSIPSFQVLNSKMYFLGHLPATPGIRLLSYDGTNPPALAPGISNYGFGFDQTDFITFDNRIFFGGGTGATGSELVAYDGLNAPIIYDINPYSPSIPHTFTAFNGKLYFVAAGDDATGNELYVYDPATDHCSLVADINPDSDWSSCQGFIVAGNKLFFTAVTLDYGRELWQYDGSALTRLTDLAAGGLNGTVSTAAYYKGHIIFAGSTDGFKYLPYKYEISTGQLARLSADSTINGLGWRAEEYKGNLYLTCTKGQFPPNSLGSELWKYDGTNLSMMPEIWPGYSGSRPDNYHVHNGHLYFTAQDSTYGNELYRLHDQTGIVNTRFDGDLKLFPNPAATQITLELTLNSPQQLSVSLSDMTGSSLYKRV